LVREAEVARARGPAVVARALEELGATPIVARYAAEPVMYAMPRYVHPIGEPRLHAPR
jgi:hypothetical protein